MPLENKTVIVTGAAGGLGEGISRSCHRAGANVVVADIREDDAQRGCRYSSNSRTGREMRCKPG